MNVTTPPVFDRDQRFKPPRCPHATGVNAKGRYTGEQHDGLGPVVEFNVPKPQFQNLGYDHFEAESFRLVEVEGELPLEQSQIPIGFQNWVLGRFTDGTRALFLYPHTSAWNDAEKRYDKPVYSVVG